MKKAKSKVLATIREDECIGCTKCIQACPVDAILGSANNMHTVIASECIGCKLCVAPCPVDCIDLAALSDAQIGTFDEQILKKSLARTRFKQRKARLFEENQAKNNPLTENNQIKRKHYIEAALARAAAKKSTLTIT